MLLLMCATGRNTVEALVNTLDPDGVMVQTPAALDTYNDG